MQQGRKERDRKGERIRRAQREKRDHELMNRLVLLADVAANQITVQERNKRLSQMVPILGELLRLHSASHCSRIAEAIMKSVDNPMDIECQHGKLVNADIIDLQSLAKLVIV